MADENRKILVTGDHGIDRFIYVEGLQEGPPNLREAWVGASRFWTEELKGGAGSVIECLKALGYNALDPYDLPPELAESIYILTRQGDAEKRKWRTALAIVAGEREIHCAKMNSMAADDLPPEVPAIFTDFNQGCLSCNKEEVYGLLRGRRYLVRTHDPRKTEWVEMREKGMQRGIWFSPVQDMFEGALHFAGNWEAMHERLLRYLKADPTLWKQDQWSHHIIIQISFDGILILSPGEENVEGQLLIFAGDQPGSFSRNGYGAVIGGGVAFVAALVPALYDWELLTKGAKEGLARLRMLAEEGYEGPPVGSSDWKLGSSTNLPIHSVDGSIQDGILAYQRRPPEAIWEAVVKMVCGTQGELRSTTVLNMGNLATCCPNYAHTLLRLESRLRNHVKSGKGIISFTIFGGPGSGKSFVAEQLALAVDPTGEVFQQQTFNLSQFSDPARLLDALQQIQTIGLQGKIPFVLWDEFDTMYQGAQGGWSPYFLMPMQDAKFFDGITDRSLGKCVFVFVGGTFNDENDFRKWALESPEGKRLKGVDFHSRLDSSLTMPSVDLGVPPAQAWQSTDPAKLIRAVMIRSFLKKQKKIRFISCEVLAYLVHVPLEHGVRSLQRIILASEIARTPVFERYHLPPADVLQLHVKGLKSGTADPVSDFVQGLDGYDIPEGAPPLELKWIK
jgi:hypothetical protein